MHNILLLIITSSFVTTTLSVPATILLYRRYRELKKDSDRENNAGREKGILREEAPPYSTENMPASSQESCKRRERDEAIIKNLEDYLDESKAYLTHNTNQKDIARKIFTNKTYLSEAVHNIIKTDFTTYINQKRIDEAKRIYSDGNRHTVGEVFTKCGFVSATTFNNVFKKITGLSPNEWYKENCNNKKTDGHATGDNNKKVR